MCNFTNVLNYGYERLIPLYFNGVYVHVYNCMHMYGFVCLYRVLFVVLFVTRVFFLFFFFLPEFVLIKLYKNPKHHHVHNCLNNFIWLVVAAVCLNVRLCRNWMPREKILNFVSPYCPLFSPYFFPLSPIFPPSLLQAIFWFLFLCFGISIKSQSSFFKVLVGDTDINPH